MPHLSVIIPAYNEARAIRAGKLAQVARWLASQGVDGELIVVDDGSHDATAELARPWAQRVVRIPHAGKAAAIVAGIQEARGEIILVTDMDLATPIAEARKLLHAVGRSADVVIGSRGLVRRGAPVGRYVLSWGHVALRGAALGLRMTDTQCGFKAMLREAALHILDHLHIYHPSVFAHRPAEPAGLNAGHAGLPMRKNIAQCCPIHGPSVTSGFDVEFLYVARRLGYRIHEVPVLWNYQETRGANLFRDSLRGLKDLAHILVENWKGGYPRRHSHKKKGGKKQS